MELDSFLRVLCSKECQLQVRGQALRPRPASPQVPGDWVLPPLRPSGPHLSSFLQALHFCIPGRAPLKPHPKITCSFLLFSHLCGTLARVSGNTTFCISFSQITGVDNILDFGSGREDRQRGGDCTGPFNPFERRRALAGVAPTVGASCGSCLCLETALEPLGKRTLRIRFRRERGLPSCVRAHVCVLEGCCGPNLFPQIHVVKPQPPLRWYWEAGPLGGDRGQMRSGRGAP